MNFLSGGGANIKSPHGSEKSPFATPGASSLHLYEYDIDQAQRLGRGSFAVVLQAKHKSTGHLVAIKVYEKFKLLDS